MGNQYTNIFLEPGTIINTKECVRFLRINDKGVKTYLFRCVLCGHESEKVPKDIGASKRCMGCIQKKECTDMVEWIRRSYQRKSKNKKRHFELSAQEFAHIIEKPCFYCGNTASNIVKYGQRQYRYNGVDRVNSDLGYSISNCVPCCKLCNYGKRDLDKDEFLDWIKRVYEHSVKGNENQ